MSKIQEYVAWCEDLGYLECTDNRYTSMVAGVEDPMAFATQYMKTKQYAREHKQAFYNEDPSKV